MAPPKVVWQIICPTCRKSAPQGSPYCNQCGTSLNNLSAVQVEQKTMRQMVPEQLLSKFQKEEQDPLLVRQIYEKALQILVEDEEIEYIAIANKTVVGTTLDCVVATNRRLIDYKKRLLGKVALDDCFWRDVEKMETKEVRHGVSLLVETIQGWNLTIESLPRSQAWRLYEVGAEHNARLRRNLQEIQASDTSPGHVSSGIHLAEDTSTIQGTAVGFARIAEEKGPPDAVTEASAPLLSGIDDIFAPLQEKEDARQSQGSILHMPSLIPEIETAPRSLGEQLEEEPVDKFVGTHLVSYQIGTQHGLLAEAANGRASNGHGRGQKLKMNGLWVAEPTQSAEATPSVVPPNPAAGESPARVHETKVEVAAAEPPHAPRQEAHDEPRKMATPGESPMRKLRQLKRMLDVGLITEADYEAKKAEILSRI